MRYLLVVLFLFHYLISFSQKLYLRDHSIGYRIGEGEAVGGNPLTIPVYLRNPTPYQTMIDGFDYNSLYGNPGPVTYHRIFLQGVFAKRNPRSRFWRSTTIGAGINFTFREKRGGIFIEKNDLYSGNTDSTYDSKKLTINQNKSFAGMHVSINRSLVRGKRLELLTGLWLQGNVAVRHLFSQTLDTSSYTPQWTQLYHSSQNLPALKGRNYVQYSILIPLALEVAAYKKQLFLRPEITVGIESNRYLSSNQISKESINAALWIVYRRK